MSAYETRVVCARSTQELEEEMVRLGADEHGVKSMVAAGLPRVVKLRGVPAAEARQLKAMMQSVGGDVAIASRVYFGEDSPTDALVLGTESAYSHLGVTARSSSLEMLDIVDAIDSALRAFAASRGTTRCGNTVFEWGSRTYVMGIINTTPDSFSKDGLGNDVEAAVRQARQFVVDGADILDVGGESTRPGHTPVSVEEEIRRVVPVIEALRGEVNVPISIDTYKAEVAYRAVEAGAGIINDIWGLRADPQMVTVAVQMDVPVILMHNQDGTQYDNLLDDVIDSLGQSIDMALGAGVKWENIIIDPGMGFGKTWRHNLAIMARLGDLRSLGRPILLGTSRKSTIGRVLDLPVDDRLEGTAATVAIGIQNGADIVRVHDVKQMVRVARMADAVVRQRWPE